MSNLSPQAQKLLMKAYQLRNEGKIEASLKQARAVAKKHAQNLHVLYLLGSLYLEKRDYVKAINFFKQGIKQDQNGHINQGGLGAALYKSGDLEQARDWLEKAHKKAPQEFSHISNLANVYYHLGDIEKARPLLENVFATTPHDIAVAQILSRIYILNEEYGQAKKVLTICANKNPSDPEILSTLSSFLESRAMINEARQINEKIFDLDSDNFRAHLSMYNVASQEGNLEEARAHLAKLALLDPMNIDTLTAAIKTKCQEEIFGDNLEKALDNILSLSDDQQRLTQLNHSTLFNVSHILETQKLYDKSFDVLNMANELKKRENEIFGMTFKQDYFRKYIENLKNFDKWDQLLSEKTGGADDDRMVFICAMPRSGTTLMEQILAAHSQSDGIGESQNLDISLRVLYRVGISSNALANGRSTLRRFA